MVGREKPVRPCKANKTSPHRNYPVSILGKTHHDSPAGKVGAFWDNHPNPSHHSSDITAGFNTIQVA